MVVGSVDREVVEREGFIPGWVQGFIDDLRAETAIGEAHPSEWIGKPGFVGSDQPSRLVHVRSQLEYVTLWQTSIILLFKT